MPINTVLNKIRELRVQTNKFAAGNYQTTGHINCWVSSFGQFKNALVKNVKGKSKYESSANRPPGGGGGYKGVP